MRTNLPFLLCAVLVIALSACQKKQAAIPGRIISFTDKDNKYRLVYNGTQVKEIHVDSGAGAPYLLVNYEYGANLVKARFEGHTGFSSVEYYMKTASLPSSIRKYKMVGNTEKLMSQVDFYYSGSNQLDSMVLTQGSAHLNFIPVYSGGNISDYYISHNYGAPILSGSFLYYNVANVFRNTNPLLFIYSTPVFEFEAFLMPRLFSANTMKRFNGGGFVYSTDSRGNLNSEDYGPNVFPFKKTYKYQ